MAPDAQSLIGEFEMAAEAARRSEEELRRRMADEVARLERQRAFAFRRTRLVRALVTGALAAATPDEVAAGQRNAVIAALAWESLTPAHEAILDALEPAGRAVWRCVCEESAGISIVKEALAEFEAGFEAAHGKSFYALFDQYVPEVPVVDF